MKLKIIGILMLISVILVGCNNETTKDEVKNTTDIKKIVHDYTVRNTVAASASITSSELIVTEENDEVTTYKLPDDEFFVSIAPFINTTHPCDIHSLTGCQGELVKEDIHVLIEDSEGNVIIDETKQTEANGFIDLWLPRDETFDIIMTQDEKESSSTISTFDGDNTCITTIKLG